MKKKSNTRKVLITVIVILSVLLAALLGLAISLMQRESDQPGTTPSTEQPQVETTQETEPEHQETEEPATEMTTEPEDLTISTKFGDHTYPGEWADQVRTEVTEMDIGGYVTYYGTVNGKEEVLFTLYYGKGSANSQPIGTMKVDGISMTVSVEMSAFHPDNTWTQEEIDTFCAMQEGLNEVIEHLKQDPNFSAAIGSVSTEPTESTEPSEGAKDPTEGAKDPTVAETTEPVVVEDMIVSTPYGELTFPGQWADQVRTESEEVGIGYAVTFYGTVADTEQVLFKVLFAADIDSSFPVGVITVDGVSMDVSIELPQLEMDSDWSQADKDAISAMQECVNYVIEKLKENKAFTPA